MNDGVTHPSIRSVLPCLPINHRFIGLMILDIDMSRSSIVHRVRHMLGEGVGVISITTLIGSGQSFHSLQGAVVADHSGTRVQRGSRR